MTIADINAEITAIREERDRILNQVNNLTACIKSLARKRERIRKELEWKGNLFEQMFS